MVEPVSGASKQPQKVGGPGGDPEDDWVPGHKRLVRHGSGSSRRRNRMGGASVSRRIMAAAAGSVQEEGPAVDAAGASADADRPPLAALPHNPNARPGPPAACIEEAAHKQPPQHASQRSRRPAGSAAASAQQQPVVPETAPGGSHSVGSGQGEPLDPIAFLFGSAAAPAPALGSKQLQARGAAGRSKAGRKGPAAQPLGAHAPADKGSGQAGRGGSMADYLRLPSGAGGGGRRGRPR